MYNLAKNETILYSIWPKIGKILKICSFLINVINFTVFLEVFPKYLSKIYKIFLSFSFNTAFVTFLNHQIQAKKFDSVLTLAHELGHSFGALHDQDTACKINVS